MTAPDCREPRSPSRGMSAALQSRTVIGQAEGILMERLGVDSDQALAYLKRISSHTNTKLVQAWCSAHTTACRGG